jgi:hypothetical protein
LAAGEDDKRHSFVIKLPKFIIVCTGIEPHHLSTLSVIIIGRTADCITCEVAHFASLLSIGYDKHINTGNKISLQLAKPDQFFEAQDATSDKLLSTNIMRRAPVDGILVKIPSLFLSFTAGTRVKIGHDTPWTDKGCSGQSNFQIFFPAKAAAGGRMCCACGNTILFSKKQT